MDGVEPERLAAARNAVLNAPGVVDAVVRGRWMGRSLTLEVEASIADETTLRHAEETGRRIESLVRDAVAEVRNVRWIPRASATFNKNEETQT